MEAERMTESTPEMVSGRITDEGLEKIRSEIGVRHRLSLPWNREASADAIWHFALGVGDDNPLWWDSEFAESGSPKARFAPPTFLYSLMNEIVPPGEPARPGDVELLPGVPGLWASDRWVWHSRIVLGEKLAAFQQLTEVREREGDFPGRSIVQTELFQFESDDGRPIADMYRTVFRFEAQEQIRANKYLELPHPIYTEEESHGIVEQYRGEAGARRGSVPRTWESVEVGETMPGLVKGPLTLTSMIGFLLGWGASQCMTNRMLYTWFDDHPAGMNRNEETGIYDTPQAAHWDPFFSRGVGMPRAFDFGAQRISFVAHLATDWCGDDGELVELEARLRAPCFLGDTMWFTGSVVDKKEGGGLVVCSIVGTNQRGEINTEATATIRLPRK
jgi:acyl dehydratase